MNKPPQMIMKKKTPLIPWPIGLALAGLLLFSAPLQSLADCNTILGFQNGDMENWTTGASATCSTAYPPLSWVIYYRSNNICLEKVSSGVEHGTYFLYEVCALKFLGGVYQDFHLQPRVRVPSHGLG